MPFFGHFIEPFKNVSDFGSVYGESLAPNNTNTDYKPESRNTESGQIQNDHYDFFCPSLMNQPNHSEISFGKNLLHEHTTSLNIQLQNLLEFGLSKCPMLNSSEQAAIRALCLDSKDVMNLRSLLKAEQLATATMNVDEFSKAVTRESDLEGFLNYILKHCSKQLAIQLITITIQIWLQFRDLDFQFQEMKELMQQAEGWVKSQVKNYFRSAAYPRLNFTQQLLQDPVRQHLLRLALQKFLNFYASTILLIVAGFFSNPYFVTNQAEGVSRTDYPKRQSSYDCEGFWSNYSDFSDDDNSLLPKKHVKQQ